MVKLCLQGEPREANGAGYNCNGCEYKCIEQSLFPDDPESSAIIWCDWWVNYDTSKQTKNDVVELVKRSRDEDKDLRIVRGQEPQQIKERKK